jgi:hypothetical protein
MLGQPSARQRGRKCGMRCRGEIARVVPVEYTDDTQHVDIKCPVGPFVIDWLVVRAVRATGTGTDISAVVMA